MEVVIRALNTTASTMKKWKRSEKAVLNNLTGYRKVFITLVAFIASIALLLANIINADQWVELNKFVIPSFMAANLAEYILRRGKSDA